MMITQPRLPVRTTDSFLLFGICTSVLGCQVIPSPPVLKHLKLVQNYDYLFALRYFIEITLLQKIDITIHFYCDEYIFISLKSYRNKPILLISVSKFSETSGTQSDIHFNNSNYNRVLTLVEITSQTSYGCADLKCIKNSTIQQFTCDLNQQLLTIYGEVFRSSTRVMGLIKIKLQCFYH
ncbi:hypothetical protein AGLY_017976 [Aphis glycines]|uniref:Uncharacterized protein n=1 Tax=Aphis glycines TaxID=307491 RepID=A0A6G0STX8_APHGL|nr:hypothetical protein AGLY_017976 [Aphis glycines]